MRRAAVPFMRCLLAITLALAATGTVAGQASAQTVQSCFGQISPTPVTMDAQRGVLSFAIFQNDVQQLSVTVDWGDSTSLAGGAGSYSHSYLKEGDYSVTLSATGFFLGQPCATPATVIFNVTVRACQAACSPPAILQQQPSGIYSAAPDPNAAKTAHCDNVPQAADDPTPRIGGLKVRYAAEGSRDSFGTIPAGWPIATFCATRTGLVRFEVYQLQGAPGLDFGVKDTYNVFVVAGSNVLIADDMPTPVQTFGLLGPFFRLQTSQSATGQVMSSKIHWGYVTWINPQRPSGPLPRVYSASAASQTFDSGPAQLRPTT